MNLTSTTAIEIDSIAKSSIRYSICTLVSNPEEYAEMVQSFIDAGFDTSFCEYLYIDNSKHNKYDAYAGLNKFLTLAQGTYIIICHQDILLNYDRIEVLEQRISEMDTLDKKWAVLGNAGAAGIKNIVYKLYNKVGELESRGTVPSKVISLDENFMLVKHSSNLAVSFNLQGFHLYATELCIIAEILGYSTYVIDFAITHKSKGNVDNSFFKIQSSLQEKYRKNFRGRYIRTTITEFYLSNNRFARIFFENKLIKFFMYQYYKIKYRRKLFDRKIRRDGQN